MLSGSGFAVLAVWVLTPLAADARGAFALQIVGLWSASLYLFLYPALLGTLNTPWSAPWRTLPGRLALGMGYTLVVCISILRPRWAIAGIERSPVLDWIAVQGPLFAAYYGVQIVIMTYAPLVSLSAWHRAPAGSAARAQAKRFAVAFVTQDLILIGWSLLSLRAEQHQWGAVQYLIAPASLTLFAVLFSYGILKDQLFDIDLKIKWTLNRSTVAATFIAVFLVATEGAQVIFGERNPWLGIAAAAMLVFALAPLQRAADRLANAAMPNVRDDDEYRTVRKREVYRATLEEMLADGVLTAKDRRALVRLQETLGLEAALAQRLEIDVLDAVDPAGGRS